MTTPILTETYDYSYLRDIVGHLAVLVFNRATEVGLPYLAEIGLTPKHGAILEFIANNPTSSQKEIAQETGTKQSLLVTILDNLTERGLLMRERSLTDRRRQHVRLTAEGEALRERLQGLMMSANEALLAESDLSVEEEQILVDLLRRLI